MFGFYGYIIYCYYNFKFMYHVLHGHLKMKCYLFFCLTWLDLTPAVWNVFVSVGGEQPIPLWNEHDVSTDGDKPKILLYSINLTFKVCTNKIVCLLILRESCRCFRLQYVFSVVGDSNDSHHSFNAGGAIWDRLDWAWTVQSGSVQDYSHRK